MLTLLQESSPLPFANLHFHPPPPPPPLASTKLLSIRMPIECPIIGIRHSNSELRLYAIYKD